MSDEKVPELEAGAHNETATPEEEEEPIVSQ